MISPKKWFYLLFCLLWIAWRIPYILYGQSLLNADVAVQLSMIADWEKSGFSKFMWGSDYLGTLEILWNVLWTKIIPFKLPFLWLPSSLIGLSADLLFIWIASRILSFSSWLILLVFLVFFPKELLYPQFQPNLTYTTVTLLSLLAILTTNGFLRGFLLGLAFYAQPISLYFTIPTFAFILWKRQERFFTKTFIGFLIPALFALLPIAGPGLDLSVLFGGGEDQRHFFPAFKLVCSSLLIFFGYPSSKENILSSHLLAIFGSIFIYTATLFLFLKNKRSYLEKMNSLPEKYQLFSKVMEFGFIFIPIFFITKKFYKFDEALPRYLWLWHYPIYFFVTYGIGHLIENGKFVRKTFLILLLGIFITLSFWQRTDFWERKDPNQIFKQTISYLREKNIQGIVGDYWATYPISFFTLKDEEPIISLPLGKAAVRVKKWRAPISILPRVAYLCLEETWCEKNPPEYLNILSSKFSKDPTSSPMSFKDSGKEILIQIYGRDR